MKIYYRLSDTGYKKVKAAYVNNENCLVNFIKNFTNGITDDITILADNICDETHSMLLKHVNKNSIIKCKLGSGAQTFNAVLDMALVQKDEDIIYFVENDYIHRKNSKLIMEEGFDLNADFVCLYDHPDKYINAEAGGNPLISGGGEITQVFLTKSCHWKLTNSTTMTFAAKAGTLKENESILRKWTTGTYPQDMKMFLELRNTGKTLISPIPGYATHGDLPWMSPLINWEIEK